MKFASDCRAYFELTRELFRANGNWDVRLDTCGGQMAVLHLLQFPTHLRPLWWQKKNTPVECRDVKYRREWRSTCQMYTENHAIMIAPLKEGERGNLQLSSFFSFTAKVASSVSEIGIGKALW